MIRLDELNQVYDRMAEADRKLSRNRRRAEQAEAALAEERATTGQQWQERAACAEARVQQLDAALREAEALLSHVRVLDCGAHYCRYCPARSPDWDHGPHCPYAESQKVAEKSHALRQRIAALRGAS